MPFLLSIYQGVTPLLQRGVTAFMQYRLKKGKEDPDCLRERFGIASRARPAGQVMWLHGASVGEAVSLLPLLTRLQAQFPDITPLVTTGTVAAARVMASVLPQGCIHQYCPVDIPAWTEAFLDHWQPCMGVFVESELWPNLVTGCKSRKIPLYLINGDISVKSLKAWRWFTGISRHLLSCFEEVMVQSQTMASRFRQMGADPAKLKVCGNMKFSALPLPYDEAEFASLEMAFDKRLTWVAASTHPGEEELIAQAHQKIKKKLLSLLTILIPRHPERGKDIAAMLQQQGLEVIRRSSNESILPSTDVYLVDTLGELGLFYRLGNIAFIGGTFCDIGGHNPIEPVLLGCAVIWGPQTHNFVDVCKILEAAGTGVKTVGELAETVQGLLTNAKLLNEKVRHGKNIVKEQSKVADVIFDRLKKEL